MPRGFPRLLSLAALLAAALSAQTRSQEYALVLADPPGTPEAWAAQGRLRAQLGRRGITVAGSLQTLANVIFVRVARNEAAALRGLPGVARVQYLPPMKRHLDRALDLVRAREAWNAVGGMTNAGAGIKIAILDTGID